MAETWLIRGATRALALALLLGAAASAQAATAAGGLALSACSIEGFGGGATDARCGTLAVPENPAEPAGKRIELSVAVIPAISRKAKSDPLFLIAGGPGQGTQEGFVPLLGALSGIRRERDLVLLDQRGTGKSNRMGCKLDEEDLDQPDLDAGRYRELAAECLKALPGRPEYYTTSVAVRDLDAVRAALGYERVNLYGVSYGTRVAQHYARRYPERVRAVILDGVVHPTFLLGPAIALDGEAALQAHFARCAADAACNAAFPDLPGQFAALRARLEKGPVEVRLNHPITGVPTVEKVGTGHLVLATRMMSYGANGASLLPLIVHEASTRGNLAPLAAQALMLGDQLADLIAFGMHNAVVCSEDLPFIDEARIDLAALERSYMGKSTYDGLVAMCSIWPRGLVDPDLRKPLHSKVPALLLSGQLDPVTPPAYAAEAAKGFSDHVHVVMAGQGHGQVGIGCVQQLMRKFLDAGTAQGLDAASCSKRVQPAPYFLSFSGPMP